MIIRVSNGLDPDRNRRSVGSDLANAATSKERVIETILYPINSVLKDVLWYLGWQTE